MQKSESNLIEILLNIQTEKEMQAFLAAMFTSQERKEISIRLEIFKMLKARVPQHEIAKQLHIGVGTVTKGSHELKRGNIQQTAWWQNQTFQLGD